MFGLGIQELVLIFLVVFLLFGAKAIPEVAKGLGQALNIFKKEINKIGEDEEKKEPVKPEQSISQDENPE